MPDNVPLLPRTPPVPRTAAKITAVSTPDSSELLTLAVFVVIVTSTYLAREVMVPITLAVLLSFVLAPLVSALRRIYIPRVLAVLLSVVLSLGVILALGGLIGMQIAKLADELPQYRAPIEAKIATVQNLTLGPLSELVDRLGHAAPAPAPPHAAAPAPPRPSATPTAPMPVQVEIQEPPLTPFQIAREFLTPILSPLATLAIVFVVAIFVLLQQVDLRDRLIRLFGSNDLHRTTLALDDAGRRLSRYFLTQLAINTGFGCVIAAGLLLIGVPSAGLWGILGTLLRFVPYVGAWLSAVIPVTLAAAVDPGWTMALSTLALYAVVELIAGQVVEPFMYGHSTGLSPISVVVAAIFWSWIWGPIGLILSTPLTLCLVVLGRHVPRLEFLDVLLGDRPALTPIESFYQRILAGDADEALVQAEQMLRERSLASYYDEVVLKGLRLAAVDVERGLLQAEQIATVLEAVTELITDLDGNNDEEPSARRASEAPVAPPPAETELPHHPPPGPDFTIDGAKSPWDAPAPVLCVAGKGPLDDAAAALLVQLLGKHGIGARAVPHSAVSRAEVGFLRSADIAMVCVCHVEVGGEPARLRYLLRRIRQQLPQARLLIGFWSNEEGVIEDERLRQAIGADFTPNTLTDAVNACLHEARTNGKAQQSERLSA